MDDFTSALSADAVKNGLLQPQPKFPHIIGCSPSISTLFEHIEVVAPTNATVLIEGETGTGKELVARAIHTCSSRSKEPFVKLNCAAIPAGLLESELFGHERGAFTGAVARRIGRLEAADHGTLFLDEVGDIPLQLQPKLLRLLQEQEFERLGSAHTTRVNVRIIAATNRNLHQLVADCQFRRDLYYRLRVFPLYIPPLRDRRQDIPLLVHHFMTVFSRRLRKRITDVSEAAMEAIAQWHWAGNVRELENFIERCVILTEGHILQVPLEEIRSQTANPCAVPGYFQPLKGRSQSGIGATASPAAVKRVQHRRLDS